MDWTTTPAPVAQHDEDPSPALAPAGPVCKERTDRVAQLRETAQRLTDNFSHEFRTPLAVITEYVSLLQDGVVGSVELDGEQQRFLRIVADRSDDLNTLVDNLIDASKQCAGLLEAWRKGCYLSDVLRHLRPNLENKASLKNVRLEFRIDNGLPAIYCDAEMLGRVCNNLISDAVKHCGDAGTVSVETVCNREGRDLVIRVSDSGPALTDHHVETLGRFGELPSSTDSASRGGLGLSVARELVELNLGQISWDSGTDNGNFVKFTVPLADPVEVSRRFLRLLQQSTRPASVAVVRVTAAMTRDSQAVGALLHFALDPGELLFNFGPRDWLFLVPDFADRVAHFATRLDQLRSVNNRNRQTPLPEFKIQALGSWSLSQEQELLATLQRTSDEVR